MKKTLIFAVVSSLLFGSCDTYSGAGAYSGAMLGSVIGSAVGGISGGYRGSDIGTLVGMAGGAVVGGAIGAQADNERQERAAQEEQEFGQRYERHRAAATRGNRQGGYDDVRNDDGSGFDPSGGGDDVLYDFQSSDYTGDYTAAEPDDVVPSVRFDQLNASAADGAMPLEVRNARFVDDNQDNLLNPGETCKLIFEVYNTSSKPISDVQPMVVETTGNKKIAISGTIHVESINPGKGIRYTAIIMAGKKLKGDNAVFRVFAVSGNNVKASNVMEFDVKIAKR